jgi:hypothetical protein
MQEIAFIVFCVFGAVVVSSLFLSHSILRRLEKMHALTWMRLGSPTLFLNNSAISSWNLLIYVWKEGVHEGDDSTLRALCKSQKMLYVISLLLAICLVLLIPIST